MRDDRDVVGSKSIPEKEELREILVNASIHMAKRGINETFFEPGVNIDQYDQWGSFFYGVDGGVDPTPFSTRMENYLGPAVFLLKDTLEDAGALSGVQGGLKTLTRRWEHGMFFLNDTVFFPEPNVNTDQSRVLLHERLLYILSLDAAGDSAGTQIQQMDAWWRWTTKALATDDTISYAFKPDGTIHHHMMIYANGYGYDTVQLAAIAAWITAGTPWQLRKSEIDNVAKSASVMQVFSAGQATPRSLGGRLFPDHSAVTAGHLCAQALISDLAEDMVSEDQKLLSKASLLHWSSTIEEQDEAFTTDCCRARNFNYLGCVRLRERSLYSLTKEKIAQDLSSRDLPSMYEPMAFHFPYAGMSVFRPGNGWVAVAKGYSRTVKNTFEYSWDSENLHGAYQGAGTLMLLSETGWMESGFETDYAGFDWYRMPGATAPHRSPDAGAYVRNGKTLYPKRDYTGDGGFVNGLWEGGDSNGIQWPDHPDSYVGGVVGPKGSNVLGVWGFRMEDMVSNYLEGSLYAYKSNFFITNADGTEQTVIALGSDINSNEADAGVVETTLFQTYIQGTEPINVNGDWHETIPYNRSWAQKDGQPLVRLMDTVGNGYVVVPRDGNSTLSVTRQMQTNAKDNAYDDTSSGNYAVASLLHGRAPNNGSYEYMIILNTTASALAAVDPKDWYTVLSLDQSMHAVQENEEQSVGIVVFRESMTSESLKAATKILKVGAACNLVVRPLKQGFSIVVANPDLGFIDPDERFNAYSSTARVLYRRESRARVTEVVMAGEWRVVPSSITSADSALGATTVHDIAVHHTFDPKNDSTVFTVAGGDGVSVQFAACPGGGGTYDCTSACLTWQKEECDPDFRKQQCVESRTWKEIMPLVEAGTVVTGGLGKLLAPGHYEIWSCFFNHDCVEGGDWMCYVFNEMSRSWEIWGRNSDLELC